MMTPQVPVDARCAWHPQVPALTICARCGSFACASCQTWDATGRLVCQACASLDVPLASRGNRFLANLIDQLVVAAPMFALVVVVSLLVANIKHDAAFLLVYPALGVGLLLGGGVQAWSQVTRGQSVGKRALGIRVVRMDGSDVDIWRLLLLRNAVMLFASQLCGLVGLADALWIFSAEQRCLHDLLADTKVVVAPPQ
jgi:uncharacterized RDD family membrane protein YckC